MKRIYIDKTSNIGEITKILPQATEILASYHLGCGGCSASEFETLSDGIISHGYSEEIVDEIIEKCNEILDEYYDTLEKKYIYITEYAQDRLDHYAEQSDMKGYGIKIERKEGEYTMDFQKAPEENQEIIEYNEDITIFFKKSDKKEIQGLMIDFVNNEFGTGFKLINVHDIMQNK